MAPTTAPSISTRALRTRCTTALKGPSWQGDPQLARQATGDREVGRAIVGLVQDTEVAPREADATEAIVAAGAAGRPHHVGAGDAVVAEGAVLARAAPLALRAVGAIDALGAIGAVVAAGQSLRLEAERALAAALAAFAREAAEVVAGAGAPGELTKGGFELGAGHRLRIGHRDASLKPRRYTGNLRSAPLSWPLEATCDPMCDTEAFDARHVRLTSLNGGVLGERPDSRPRPVGGERIDSFRACRERATGAADCASSRLARLLEALRGGGRRPGVGHVPPGALRRRGHPRQRRQAVDSRPARRDGATQ